MAAWQCTGIVSSSQDKSKRTKRWVSHASLHSSELEPYISSISAEDETYISVSAEEDSDRSLTPSYQRNKLVSPKLVSPDISIAKRPCPWTRTSPCAGPSSITDVPLPSEIPEEDGLSVSAVPPSNNFHKSLSPLGDGADINFRKSLSPLGDGADDFIEMDTKTFQYNVLMRFAMLEAAVNQLSSSVESLGQRIEPEFHFVLMTSIEDFSEMETKLEDDEFFHLTVSRLKKVGVFTGNVRRTLRYILDEIMSRSLQSLFNRDGRSKKGDPNRKYPFGNSLLYSCIRDAVSNTFTMNEVKGAIGDVLKRVTQRKSDTGQTF